MSMRNTLLAYIDRFRHDRRQRAMLGSVLLVLAVIVTLLVYWQLRLSGIAMTNETYCGYEEHVHTDECYEYTLICELEETGHVHDESCYEEQQVLICGLDESEGHTHSESCYDEEGNLVCGLEESEGHTHSESCYETQTVLICGQEETPDAHVHTDECYEKTLICELEEHTHTVECLIDLTADVEDETIWSATIPELTGDLRTDIVAIAESQVGYTESTANYSLGEDGITHYGYTRYGAWYGSEYADWDSIFAAFCLDYAGIADEFSYNAGSFAWTVDLANLGYYQSADSYVPSAGDLVFIDTDLDGRADKTAVVVSVDNVFSTVTAIQGNYTVTDVDGNSIDTVAYVTYSMTATAAPVLATISEDGETVDDVAPVILGYANVSYVAEVETTDEEVTEDEVIDDEEVDLEGETDEEITDEEITDETTETEVVGSAAVLTYAGEDYTITVTYGEDALIPEGTYLVAYEYSSDSETYLQRYAESAAIYGWEGEPTEDFRVFNIGLYYDGVEIEPAAEIQVSITYTATENSDSVSVTHHDETAEPLYAVSEYSEETGTETVTFTTDGFSDYSFMLMSTGNEEGNNVTGTASNSAVDTLYTNLDNASLSNSTVSWTASNVSYANGTFTMELLTNFTINSKDVTSGATYYVYLPEDFEVSSDAIDYEYTGTDTDNNEAFHYYFEVDSQGNYYIKIVFDIQSYVDSVSGTSTTLKGKIDYKQYSIKGEDVDDSYNEGYVVFDDSLDIKVSVNDVTHDDDDSWILDINVTKSAAKYNSETNSITYTIEVSSTLGTGDTITISDILKLYNNLSYTDELSVEKIEVDSVTYQVYTKDQYGNMNWTDADYTSTSINYSYTYGNTTKGEELTITLPQLYGATSNNSYTSTSDRFEIKYTVYFDDTDGAVSSSVINKASGTSTKDGDTQSSESSYVTVSVTSTNVSKSGEMNYNTGYITWTITYNASNANIAGTSIVDEMLADAVSGVTVTSKDSNGTTTTSTAGSDYTVVTDNDGNITSIVFNALDEDGDGTADGNTRTYTITYQTPVSLGTSGYIPNEVDVEKDGKVIDEGEGSVNIQGFGKITKSVTAGDKSSDGNTRELKWTSSITVPATGIGAGTTITDYLGSSSDYTSLSSTKQWFTYTQLKVLMDNLATLTVGSKTYTYGTDYSIQVYGFTSSDSTGAGEWIDYDTISANPTAYSNYVFTAWQITLINDIDSVGTVELNYSSTADISQVTTSQSYSNYIYVGDREASAGYTERIVVYKTDGNGNSSNTEPTVTDGVITWKIFVSVDGLTTDSGNIVITDTLPKDVSLQSLLVSLGYTGASATLSNNSSTVEDGTYTLTFSYWNGTTTVYPELTVKVETNSDGQSVLTITVPYDVYSIAAGNSYPYLVLTVTTMIDGWDTEVDASNISVTHTMNNEVSVAYTDGETYEDDQQQTVEHEYVEAGTSTDFTHDEVEKTADMSAMGKDNLFDYEVLVNLDGETLNSGNDLTLTDALKVYTGLDAELIYSSVHFYYLYELDEVDNGDGTYNYVYYTYTYGTDEQTGEETKTVKSTVTVYSNVDEISTWASGDSSIYIYEESDGTTYTYYYMVLASSKEIPWNYEEVVPDIWNPTNVELTLTATVPDRTPLLFTYTYYITCTSGSIYLTNTATLSVNGTEVDKDQEGGGYNYQEPQSSGTITNAGGLTVIKSGEHTSDFIEGTTFTLYKYDSSSETWEQVIDDDTGDAIVYTTNQSGSFSVVPGTYDSDGNIIDYYKWYTPNTLYYLIETSTPSDYLLDDETKYYFYWYDAASTVILEYPSGWNTETDVSQITTTSATRLNIYNTPITSFNLKKVSITDNTTPVEDAVFALYEWSDTKNDWVRIGTYITDSKGEIVITFDENLYAFNKAYKLTEVTPAEGYNVGYYDVTEFYFWWNSSLYATHSLPDNWGDDTVADNPYAVVYDIAAQSEDVTATNTKTTTSVAVKKLWVDEWGNDVSSSGTYSTTVQLYYYALPLDSNGNPIRTNASTTSNIVMIESATSGTTAALFTQTFSGLNLDDNGWTSLSARMDSTKVSSFASAIYNDDYNDSYVEVIVAGGDQPSNMSLIVQCNGVNVTVSPSSVVETLEGTTSIYTIKYSVSNIKNALSANGITSASSVNGICLAGAGYGGEGLVRSISVVAPMNVGYTSGTITSSNDYDGTYSSWHGYLWGQTSAIPSLETDGAIIRITYSYTSGSDVSIGIRFNNSDAAENNITLYKTFSSTSNTFLIPVSEIMSGSSLSLDDFTCIYVGSNQYNGNGFVGTITSVEVLVPAASTTTTVYEIAAEDDSGISLTVGTDAYADWMRAFVDYGYANSTLKSYLSTSGAVIRVYYTNSLSSSSTLGALIQSYYDDGNGTVTQGNLTATTATIGTGSSYVDFYVDSFTADSVFSWDYFNCVYLYGYDGVTVTDVQILTPYVIEAGISPAGSSTVTLYQPTSWYYTDAMTAGDWIYNYISDYNGEPDYVVGELADDEDDRAYTGYGFLDAIYSDSATTVEITLSGVSISGGNSTGVLTTDLLKLALIVQGDASVGTNGYGAMCTVYPSSVDDNKDGTYTLYYSTSTMTTVLSAGNYDTAADACADYNGLVLALGINDSSFTATLTDLKVTGTVADFYSETALEGNYYDGEPYTTTDVNGNEVTYTYKLNEANDWSVSIAGLPMGYTENGTKYAYFYYFVETAKDSATGVDTNKYNLYTTYSQIEGESEGGEIVVVNTLVENTAVTVNKEWYDDSGKQLTSGDVFEKGWVIVELYYYLVDESTGDIYYNGTTEDNTTVLTNATSNLSELVGKGSNVTSYLAGTQNLNYSTYNWTYTFSKLAKYSIVGSTKYTRYYYFVETVSGASGVTKITYSQLTGVTDTNTPITISNTVGDDSVGYRLPSTGGQNERIYIFFGLTLMVLALLGCAYRNIHRIRFSAASNDTPVRKPSKPGAPSEEKCLRHQKKLSKDRNGDSRAGPNS